VATNIYVLGLGGEQLTELSVSGSTVTATHNNYYVGGGLLATYYNSAWHYQLADWLGSRRVQMSAAGGKELGFSSMPFGDGLTATAYISGAADTTENHFTGKERDAESGLDYFGARYLASSIGRFMSPDPLMSSGDPASPQSWNRYAYVENNPIRYNDPTGQIKRAAAGNPVFTPVGSPTTVTHPSGQSSTVQPGYLTADDGTHIDVFQNTGSNHALDTDCHGLTFADGQYWVSDPAVNGLLKGDSYQTTTAAKPGDVLVYKDANGNVVHSVTVTEVDANGKPTKVSGLGGVEMT
jgi:RHS repeat-associated protein